MDPLKRAAYSMEATRISSTDFPALRGTLDVFQRSTDCLLVSDERELDLLVRWTGAIYGLGFCHEPLTRFDLGQRPGCRNVFGVSAKIQEF